MSKETFLFMIAGFILGVFFRSYLNLGLYFSIFIVFVSVVVFLYTYFCRQSLINYQKLLFFSIFILFLGIGFLRYDISEVRSDKIFLDGFLGEKISAEGIITEEPDERENDTRLVVSLIKINSVESDKKLESSVLVTVNNYPRYKYGDKIEILGSLKDPVNYESNGRIFDYKSYLAKDGIFYEMKQPKVVLISHDNGNAFRGALFKIKGAFMKNIENVIPEPGASFMGGLLLGARKSINKDLLNNFRIDGVIHVVVLSGYNITIVAESIMKFFSFLPKIFNSCIGVASIIIFALVTGGSSTVVRASIMMLIVILARSTGRPYNVLRGLILAGVFMVFYNPKILVFDSSFQLSFMATLGLILLPQYIEKYFIFITDKFNLREMVVSTISTQIFVLPLILYSTGLLSLVALPVNFLILAFVPITMFFGFLTGVFGFLGNIFSLIPAYISTAFISYELFVVNFFAKIPYAAITISQFSSFLLFIIYVVYGILIFTFNKNKGSSKQSS
ncbi:MAG: ComEC/Rec2 family competence protein [Candidatus Paceibacterota bacterium]